MSRPLSRGQVKALLASLKKDSQEAQEAVRNIKEGIKTLPDGRIVLGGLLTGRAWILFTNFQTLMNYNNENEFEAAYKIGADTIRRYEESLELEKQVGNRLADVIPVEPTISQLYWMSARAAFKTGGQATAEKWARKAVSMDSTPEAEVVLVRILLDSGKIAEGRQVIEENFEKFGESMFKQLSITHLGQDSIP
jgi:hypothetical protein